MTVLAARGLSIGWGGRVERVLASGIELRAEAGELVALAGPNGSGKSTLLRSLVGLQAPLAGRVDLCGEDSSRLSAGERSRLAASVFTDRFDSGYFSVFDVVAFGRYPYTDARGRLEPRDIEAVRAAMASVGLSPLASRSFAELSDGEKQKAMIARAIAQDCPLLVLDEPTAFLDAPARVEVFHIARRLARGSGKAVVLSTHDIDHALRYADRLWLLDREHRFRAGAPEDLVLSGSVGRAFDAEGFRFDMARGGFASAEEEANILVELSGPEGASKAWAKRLAERLGLAAVDARGDFGGAPDAGGEGPRARPIARVLVEESEGGPLFTVYPIERESGAAEDGAPPPAGRIEAASYEELAAALKDISES